MLHWIPASFLPSECTASIGFVSLYLLTHWGRVTHICVGKLTIIGSDNGLSPGRHQAIIWTNAGILLIGPLGTNFNEILIKIHTFSFKNIHLKMSSGKWRPFCLSLNVLMWSDTAAYVYNIYVLVCAMLIWLSKLFKFSMSCHRCILLVVYSIIPNFNSSTVEVWEWLSNFIPHFTGYVVTYPCWD